MKMKTFEEFIAKFPECSIQAYDIAKEAWEEQQKVINYINNINQEELNAWDDDKETVDVLPFTPLKTRIDFGPV